MEEAIRSILSNYSENKELIDKEGLKQIKNIFCDTYALHDYVKDVSILPFKKNEKDTLGEYNSKKGILLHSNNINNLINDIIREYKELYNYTEEQEVEIYYLKNILIIQILLHELVHALCRKMIEKDSSLEATILNACDRKDNVIVGITEKDDMKELERIEMNQTSRLLVYKIFYKFNPEERMAELMSYDILLYSIYPMKDEIPMVYDYIIFEFYRQILDSYCLLPSPKMHPTKYYLNKIIYDETWEHLSFYNKDEEELRKNIYSQYCFMDRVRLGLSIQSEEFNNLKQVYSSCNVYKKRQIQSMKDIVTKNLK